MQFAIHKTIIPKKRSPVKGLINLLIIIIAVPVIIIAGISLSIYFLFLWLKDIVSRKKLVDSPEDHYHLELDLIHNEHIHIVIMEDEFDIELTRLNESWQEKVYNEETCLYRIKTIPQVAALEGSVCCFFYKEVYNGLLLQVLPGDSNQNVFALNSELVFLDYKNFDITIVDKTGPFFLYNDDKNKQYIKGFNKSETISLELLQIGNQPF